MEENVTEETLDINSPPPRPKNSSPSEIPILSVSLKRKPLNEEFNPLPERSDGFFCSPQWLSKVMGFPISSIDIKAITGEGVYSKCYKVSFVNQENQQTGSVFVKYYFDAVEKLQKRIMWVFSGRVEKLAKKEAYFYTNVKEFLDINGMHSPKVYYLGTEDDEQRATLVYLLGFTSNFRLLMIFEDLSHLKYYGRSGLLPEHVSAATMRTLAHFHALNWNIKRFDPDLEPENYQFLFNCDPNFLTKLPEPDDLKQIVNSWEKECTSLSDPAILKALLQFSNHYPKISKKYFHLKTMTYGNLFRHFTFLHGDLHTGNIFYQLEPAPDSTSPEVVKDIFFLDWQHFGYSHAANDIADLLFNTDTHGNETADRGLLEIYYEELTKTVPRETYPFSAFEREVDIRIMGMTTTFCNFMKAQGDPESAQKFNEMMGNENPESISATNIKLLKCLIKFKDIVEKWDKNNIWEDPDKLDT